jgi:hypothetical protein
MKFLLLVVVAVLLVVVVVNGQRQLALPDPKSCANRKKKFHFLISSSLSVLNQDFYNNNRSKTRFLEGSPGCGSQLLFLMGTWTHKEFRGGLVRC